MAELTRGFPARAAVETWATNLSPIEEWPDLVDPWDHQARETVLLVSILPFLLLSAGSTHGDRPCGRQLAAHILIATAARLCAKGDLPPLLLRLDFEVMGKLLRLAAKSTPSGVNERVPDQAETRG